MRLELKADQLSLLNEMLHREAINQNLHLNQLQALGVQLAQLIEAALNETETDAVNTFDPEMGSSQVSTHLEGETSGNGTKTPTAVIDIDNAELVAREYGTRAQAEAPLLAELISQLEPEISTLISDFVKGNKVGG